VVVPDVPLRSTRPSEQAGCMSDRVEGYRVQVLAGSFSGFKGVVLQAEPGRAIVQIRIFERDTPVALESDQLGPDDDDKGGGGAGVREPRNPIGPLDDLHVHGEDLEQGLAE
jgi:hypothetical protein